MFFVTLNLLTSLCNIHLLFSCIFNIIVRLEYYIVNPRGSIHFLSILLQYSGRSTFYFIPIVSTAILFPYRNLFFCVATFFFMSQPASLLSNQIIRTFSCPLKIFHTISIFLHPPTISISPSN